MGRLVKIILFLVLLIVIVAVALPFFIDPNDYKTEIQSAVKEKTGRELVIDGDLKLSVFPWLGVSTGGLVLSNAPGFADKPFAKIEASHVKVKLLPLLSKKLEVSRIELQGLDLYLAKDKQGVSNWDDLIKTESAENQPEAEDDKETGNALAALALGGINLEQAHIIWDDQQQGKYTEINDLNLTTGSLAFNRPIDVDLSLKLSNKEPDVAETLSVTTDLTINEQLNVISLKNIDINSLTTGKAIPGEKLTTTIQSDVVVDLVQQTVSVSNLKLNLDELTEEKLRVKLLSDIAINLTEQSIKTSGLNLTADNLMQNKLSANLLADINANMTQQTLSVSALRLNAGELKLTGEITGNQIVDNPKLKGSINVEPFNLAGFLKKLEMTLPEMKDPKVLNYLSMAFNLDATKDSANIQNLAIKLDETNITGSASVKNFSKPVTRFNINVDSIDAGRYLPPEQKPKKVATPAAAAVAATQLFPVETLRELNANGQISIGNLTMDQIKLTGINLKLNAANGVIKTRQAIKQLYQGSYSGNSSINVQNKLPLLSLNEKLTNIQVEPLFKALDITDRMSGVVNASAVIQGKGNTTEAIKSSLKGNIGFNFSDSLIKGFNLQKIIDGSRLLIEGRALPAENKNDQTVFSVIEGSAQINNGLVSNDDLLAESSKVKVVGKGTANLTTEALKYSIDARLLKSGEEGKFKGLPLAVLVGGTFSEPTYRPDIETMVKAKFQGKIDKEKAKLDKKIDKEKDKVLKKLDEKLGPGVGDVLKGLF